MQRRDAMVHSLEQRMSQLRSQLEEIRAKDKASEDQIHQLINRAVISAVCSAKRGPLVIAALCYAAGVYGATAKRLFVGGIRVPER